MKIIAVTSGKGGVGKTALAANLGIAFSLKGQRVVVFDADLGLANLDVLLGIKAEFTLQHVLDGTTSLPEALIEGPGGIRIVAGGSGVGKLLRISRKRLQEFLLQVAELESSTDILMFDTASGADAHVMTFARCADQVLLVATPDPASILDAYATAKVLLRHKPDAFIRVILNLVTEEAQARRVFSAMQAITQRFLDKDLYYGGCVRQDPRVTHWTRLSKPFLLAEPKSPASRDVAALAANLAVQPAERTGDSVAERIQAAFGMAQREAA